MPTYLDIILYDDKRIKNIKNKKELKETNKLEKPKEIKEIKEIKETKETKEIKETKETKEIKETKTKELNIKNIFEENKKNILDSFVNYPRLELIKKYKIQTYQFLMNKNYRNTFLKFLIIPITFELCYNIFSL
jgi:hypothetical protein